MTHMTQERGSLFDVWTEEGSLDRCVVHLRGELDLAVVQERGAELLGIIDQATPTVSLDLGALGFADSTAVRLLVDMRLLAQRSGKKLLLRNVSKPVGRVLDVAGLLTWFEYDDRPPTDTCPMCDGEILEGSSRCSRCGSAV